MLAEFLLDEIEVGACDCFGERTEEVVGGDTRGEAGDREDEGRALD